MIGHCTCFRENDDLPLSRSPAVKKSVTGQISFTTHTACRIFVVTALFRRRTTNSSGGSVYSVSVESRKITPKLTGQVHLC